MFVNDLPNVVRNCSVLMYADDILFCFLADSDVSAIQDKFNDDLDLLEIWSVRDNCLFIITSKTESMLF